jgi:hypothetical protein
MKWYKNGAFWFWIIVALISVIYFAYHKHQQTQQALQQNVSTHSNCSPDYTPCVPNVDYDLDCADIGYSVSVIGTDVYHLDADGDGVGCESY